MKVLVVNNMVPGMRGGAEELADQLVVNLRQAGHQSELLRIPFTWHPPERIIGEMLMCRSMRLVNVDRVIAMKFPAYLLPFKNKVFWLAHQYRQAYDMWDSGHSNIPDTPEGRQIRAAITEADNDAISMAQSVYAVGRTVQDRLMNYNGIPSELMRAPLNDPELFTGGKYGDYIFAGGRINAGKRQHRLVEALAQTRSPVKLIIAGPADTPEDERRLRALVESHGLQGRVKLDIGFHPRQVIADYVNGALACAYLPMAEDSFGYVTMEACQSRKAVITVDDSGDLTELVKHGANGWVCADDTGEIAAAMTEAFASRAQTRERGDNAYDSWTRLDINWASTVEKLTR